MSDERLDSCKHLRSDHKTVNTSCVALTFMQWTLHWVHRLINANELGLIFTITENSPDTWSQFVNIGYFKTALDLAHPIRNLKCLLYSSLKGLSFTFSSSVSHHEAVFALMSDVSVCLWIIWHFGLCPSTHTHTHVGFPCFMGTFHRRNGFYTVQTVYSIPLHCPYP